MAAVTMTTEPYPAQASGAPASLRLAGGLGAEGGAWLSGGVKRARAELARLSEQFGLAIDPDAIVG
ncbi:MAG: hypothetical protein ACK49H_06380, partial [Burkholderiales bacterium]